MKISLSDVQNISSDDFEEVYNYFQKNKKEAPLYSSKIVSLNKNDRVKEFYTKEVIRDFINDITEDDLVNYNEQTIVQTIISIIERKCLSLKYDMDIYDLRLNYMDRKKFEERYDWGITEEYSIKIKNWWDY